MKNNFPNGIWPVMLTPFTEKNEVDYNGLEALVEWYIKEGANGLFAIAQSGEMFFLNQEEKIKIARFVKEKAAGRVPVAVSGHTADSLTEQAEEVIKMAEAGADAVILITNRLCGREESDQVWQERLEQLLDMIPDDIKLGMYECPYPYKRLLSREMLTWCADTGRFYFLKDTCCDSQEIAGRLEICQNTNIKLFNANTTTLLDSLRHGGAGYSGIMANMQCRLYRELFDRCCDEGSGNQTSDRSSRRIEELAGALSLCALIERQWYPANAKYYLQQEGLPITTKCRVQDDSGLTETFKQEMGILKEITVKLETAYKKGGL